MQKQANVYIWKKKKKFRCFSPKPETEGRMPLNYFDGSNISGAVEFLVVCVSHVYRQSRPYASDTKRRMNT